jgi:type II secretory pathway pseudopilin PulG
MPEVLVVIMMIGILAAVVAPGFNCQKGRAQDSLGKSQARTAASAMESYANDNLGAYDGATASVLHSINAQIPSNIGVNAFANCSGDGNTTCYWVESPADPITGNKFKLTKKTDGRLLSDCTTRSRGGCPSNGKWNAE